MISGTRRSSSWDSRKKTEQHILCEGEKIAIDIKLNEIGVNEEVVAPGRSCSLMRSCSEVPSSFTRVLPNP